MECLDSLSYALGIDMNAMSPVPGMLRSLRAEHGLRAPSRPPECWHISLHTLGVYLGIPWDKVAAAYEIAEQVAARIPPFPVSFERMLSFSGSRTGVRPLVLCESGENDALQDLFRMLRIELEQRDLPHSNAARITPHVTLLYDRVSVPEYGISPIQWQVSEFALVDSKIGQSRRLPLGRWKLRGHRSFN